MKYRIITAGVFFVSVYPFAKLFSYLAVGFVELIVFTIFHFNLNLPVEEIETVEQFAFFLISVSISFSVAWAGYSYAQTGSINSMRSAGKIFVIGFFTTIIGWWLHATIYNALFKDKRYSTQCEQACAQRGLILTSHSYSTQESSIECTCSDDGWGTTEVIINK